MKKQLHFKKTTNSVILTWIMMIIILASVKTTQGQTAHFYLDSLQGYIIKYCQSDYNQVWLYKPVNAHTNVKWEIPQSIYADSILLTASNSNNGMSFFSTETGWINFAFYLVNGPVNPSLPNINTCGTIFSYVVNSGNSGINATWLWNSGTTTRRDTITTDGIKWVTIENGCGVAVTDTFEVIVDHSNDANLGQNIISCLFDTVTLSTGNTNITNYAWSNTANTSSIDVYASGTYSVTTTDNAGCVSVDSMNFTVLQPPTKQICYAGFDTITFKNNIYFPTNLTANIDSFHVYKEVSLGTWNYIGNAVAGSDFFTDLNCSPEAQSYSYKIAVMDTCGNEGTKSAAHTTITLLATYDQGTNTYGFTWSGYVGLTVTDYYLYGINSSGITTLIGSVNGNQFMYNYVNPSPLFVRYFVAFQTPGCTSKTNVLVKSNWVQSVLTGVNELTNQTLKVYPNPAKDIVRIDGALGGTLRLFDLTGRLVFEQVNKDGYINISTLAKGSYILELRSDKGILKTKLFKE